MLQQKDLEIPAADLVTGEWIHVVGVYNGANAKIFLNWVLKDSHILTEH